MLIIAVIHRHQRLVKLLVASSLLLAQHLLVLIGSAQGDFRLHTPHEAMLLRQERYMFPFFLKRVIILKCRNVWVCICKYELQGNECAPRG